MKYKKIGLFLSLCLIFCLVSAWAYAGRESLRNPPQQIATESGDTPFALQVTYGDLDTGNRVFQVGSRGDVAIFDENGTTTYSISESGAAASDPVAASYTTGTGFSITASDGNIWYIDTNLAGSGATGYGTSGTIAFEYGETGVTVVLPSTITASMDGQPMTFVKICSGITQLVLYAGATATSGVSIFDASGVTSDEFDIDSQGNSITIVPDYTAQIYWVTAVQEI